MANDVMQKDSLFPLGLEAFLERELAVLAEARREVGGRPAKLTHRQNPNLVLRLPPSGLGARRLPLRRHALKADRNHHVSLVGALPLAGQSFVEFLHFCGLLS